MTRLVQKPFSSQLLELLLLQSPQRLARLAERWGAPSAEPAAIYRHMIADREQLERLVLDAEWVGTTQSVLVDVMQDFGLPVSLYREDRTAQRELADCGLIYPYPEEWGVDEASQRPWTMPVELAVMCARVVPIYRARLPLLLGHLDDDRLAFIGDNLGVKLASTHPERVLQLCRHLMRSEHLEQFLLAPEWYDHIFTLQIVFEWHGICHRQELFSFAWGDDTLRPLTPPDQQVREQLVERDLADSGLIYTYRPPDPDLDATRTLRERLENPEVHDGQPVELLILPEELRLGVWQLSRELQEFATRDTVDGLGGWSEDGEGRTLELDDEPVDRLKGLVCVLEANGPMRWAAEPEDTHDLPGQPVELDPTGPHWPALIEVGLLSGVLVERLVPGGQELAIGPKAARGLDDGPAAWAHQTLDLWVRGVGPKAVDLAQNVALGLSEEWLDEIRPLTVGAHRRAPALEAWWMALEGIEEEPADAPLPPRPRRHQRPMPSWLSAGGAPAALDIWCGNPRAEADRKTLQSELVTMEGVITTFRLLLLDVLSGLPARRATPVAEFGYLAQDVAALALQLNLAILLFDSNGLTFVPLRPPSFLVEPGTDDLFVAFGRSLLEGVLAPAGVVEFTADRESFVVLPGRIVVETPPWYDHEARQEALASAMGVERGELGRRKRSPWHIRQVRVLEVETDRRLWLGRPLEELRTAVAGRAITALRGGYLEMG